MEDRLGCTDKYLYLLLRTTVRFATFVHRSPRMTDGPRRGEDGGGLSVCSRAWWAVGLRYFVRLQTHGYMPQTHGYYRYWFLAKRQMGSMSRPLTGLQV